MSEPDGFIDEKMSKIFGRSWRTSVGAWGGFACSIVVVADQFVANPILHAASGICMALGLSSASMGLMRAKDAKVTGLPK